MAEYIEREALMAVLEAKADMVLPDFAPGFHAAVKCVKAMIAANEVLRMGPGRAEAFCQAYIEAMNDMARLTVEAQKDDKEFVYAKEKIDQRIRAIVGEKNFVPWEERYGK